jgi:short-subunit dehydrogenase
MKVAGTRVVITGASSGIGAAAAQAFADRGAEVVLLARSRDGLDAVVQSIRARGGTAHAYPVDLSDLGAVAQVATRLQSDLGTVDVLVNNAGAGRWTAIDETEPTEALAMTMVPYVGAFAITHHLVRPMIERGSGTIVNITSPAGALPFPGSAAYSVARGAMAYFTRALRADLRGTGVHAVLVMAGDVASEYWTNNPGARDRIPTISRLFGTLTTDQVAQSVVRAVERDRGDLTTPRRLAAVLGLHRVVPGPIEWLVQRTGWSRPSPSPSRPHRRSHHGR